MWAVGRLTAALAVAVCCAAPAAPAVADPTPKPTPAPTPTSAPAVPKTLIEENGTYSVGKDIEPGIYRSDGPVEGQSCYWKRMQGENMVDNALTKKPQIVQIEPTDTTFKTDRCQPWRKTECPPDCVTTPSRPPGVLPPQLKDLIDHPPQAPGG